MPTLTICCCRFLARQRQLRSCNVLLPYRADAKRPSTRTVLRGLGRFDQQMGEFLLDYSQVREEPDPVKVVMTFLQEAYSAAADLAK